MFFDTTKSELAFTTSSPFHLSFDATAEAPPKRVFEVLADDAAMKKWFADCKDIRWTSNAPYGVGSTREVQLKMLSVKERFLAWEPGVRMTFSIDAISIPLVKALVEDIQLEALGEKGTRIVWTVHYEPSLVMRAAHPVAKMIFGKMWRASLAGLVKYADAHG
ncbi:MAG: SRPBCC family protein [Polyangiaceae bacterium]